MSEYILKSEAIKVIQKYGVGCLNADDFLPEQCERFVINKLNELPSVTPQEPKSEWEHDHEILKAYSDGSNEILDKLRAEIEKLEYLNIEDGSDGYDHYVDRNDVLEIIDKYRAESENK